MAGSGTRDWTLPVRLLGAPVRLNIGWFMVATLIGWSLAMGSLPVVYAGLPLATYWAMTGVIIIGFWLSVLLHEFVHVLTARALGIEVNDIELFVFGGVAQLNAAPRSALSDLALALSGPAFSVVLSAVLAVGAGWGIAVNVPDLIFGSLTFLAALNIVVAALNLLPAFPLDGGRAVRALLWMATGDLGRATRLATRASLGLSFLLLAGGIFQAVRFSIEGGIWTLLVGVFVQYVVRTAPNDVAAAGPAPEAPHREPVLLNGVDAQHA